MPQVKDEVSQLVAKMRGRDVAVEDTKRWYKTTKASAGDFTVKSTTESFKPGKIYVFRYENPVKQNKLWDRNPVVLSLGVDEGLDVGLNLNFFPYPKRLDLLDRVYDQYQGLIDRAIQLSAGDATSEQYLPQMRYDIIKRFLEKYDYMKAYRRYYTNKRTNSAVISYTVWNRAVLLDIADIADGDINKAYAKTK